MDLIDDYGYMYTTLDASIWIPTVTAECQTNGKIIESKLQEGNIFIFLEINSFKRDKNV